MPTTCSKKRGNRRSVNNPEGGAASTAENSTAAVRFSEEPRISTQAFKNPGTPPIRRMPSIKSVLETPSAIPADDIAENTAPKPLDVGQPEQKEDTVSAPLVTEQQTATQSTAEEQKQEDFDSCWRAMFEELFAQHPMIYYPLKDIIPTMKDDVVRFEVQNEFQKNQCEMYKRAMLEYWRNHFSINVDDMEIVTNENLETKKVIYSTEDKLNNMMEQNSELQNFLKELNFRVKD